MGEKGGYLIMSVVVVEAWSWKCRWEVGSGCFRRARGGGVVRG